MLAVIIQLGLRVALTSALTLTITPRQLISHCSAAQLDYFFNSQEHTRHTLRSLERLFSYPEFSYQESWVASQPAISFLNVILDCAKERTELKRGIGTKAAPQMAPTQDGNVTTEGAQDQAGNPDFDICPPLQSLLPIYLFQETSVYTLWAETHWDVLQSVVVVGTDRLIISHFSEPMQKRLLQTIVDDPVKQQLALSVCRYILSDSIWTDGSLWRLFDGPCIVSRMEERLPILEAVNHIRTLAKGGNILAKIRLAMIHRHLFQDKAQWLLLSAIHVPGYEKSLGCKLGLALQSFVDPDYLNTFNSSLSPLKKILSVLNNHSEELGLDEQDRATFSFEALSTFLSTEPSTTLSNKVWEQLEQLIMDLLNRWGPDQISPYLANWLLLALKRAPLSGFPSAWEEVRQAPSPTGHFPLAILPRSVRVSQWRRQHIALTRREAGFNPYEFSQYVFADTTDFNSLLIVEASRAKSVRQTGKYVSFLCSVLGSKRSPPAALARLRYKLRLFWRGRLHSVALCGAPLPRLRPELRQLLCSEDPPKEGPQAFQQVLRKSCWRDPPPQETTISLIYKTLRTEFLRWGLAPLYQSTDDDSDTDSESTGDDRSSIDYDFDDDALNSDNGGDDETNAEGAN